MNQYIANFVRRLENRYSVDAAEMGVADWITKNTTLRGRPFSFTRYPFQRQIADDLHPNLDVIKCSQVGLTEIELRKALAIVRRHRGISGVFTLPEEKMFKRVSQTRLQPLVASDHVFNLEEDAGAVRSMNLIQLGSSFLYVTGATEGDTTSINADFVFNDEVDLTDKTMLALFNSRLQGSDMRINQRFSTPTHIDVGIHLGFKNSDQHEYLCKCDACGHWNIPEFERKFIEIPGLPEDLEDLSEIDTHISDKLDLLNAFVVCEKCRAPLDLGREDNREWVPRHPSRTHARGYRVTPFCTSRLSVEYIVTQLLKYKERDFIQGWWNTVLGIPFTPGNARLDVGAISRCFTAKVSPPEVSSDVPCFIGIDVGQTCHVTVGTPESIVLFTTVAANDLVPYVQQLLITYNVVGGCVDRFPYTPTAEELRDISGGRILPVEYRGTADMKVIEDAEENPLHLQANRTWLLDHLAKTVRTQRIRFCGYGPYKQTIIDHLRDQVREETPEKPASWKKITGQDHFAHSLAFYLLALKYNEHKLSQGTPNIMFGYAIPTTNNSLPNIFGGITKKKKAALPVLGDWR